MIIKQNAWKFYPVSAFFLKIVFCVYFRKKHKWKGINKAIFTNVRSRTSDNSVKMCGVQVKSRLLVMYKYPEFLLKVLKYLYFMAPLGESEFRIRSSIRVWRRHRQSSTVCIWTILTTNPLISSNIFILLGLYRLESIGYECSLQIHSVVSSISMILHNHLLYQTIYLRVFWWVVNLSACFSASGCFISHLLSFTLTQPLCISTHINGDTFSSRSQSRLPWVNQSMALWPRGTWAAFNLELLRRQFFLVLNLHLMRFIVPAENHSYNIHYDIF